MGGNEHTETQAHKIDHRFLTTIFSRHVCVVIVASLVVAEYGGKCDVVVGDYIVQ